MKDIQSMWNASSRRLTGAGLLLALIAGGCISPQLLQDKENEIVTLREERARLKKDLRMAQGEVQSLEVALAEATMNRSDVVDLIPMTSDYPEFEGLGIKTSRRDGNLVITVPSEITFGSGKAQLTSQGQEALHVVASTLGREYPDHTYWIEGHTDSDPISKANFESNRDLSVARALSVLHFLVEDCLIPDAQCVVAGHGEYRPVAQNSGNAKARNRRVEIVVHLPQ